MFGKFTDAQPSQALTAAREQPGLWLPEIVGTVAEGCAAHARAARRPIRQRRPGVERRGDGRGRSHARLPCGVRRISVVMFCDLRTASSLGPQFLPYVGDWSTTVWPSVCVRDC
jgi:hypothetical protein